MYLSYHIFQSQIFIGPGQYSALLLQTVTRVPTAQENGKKYSLSGWHREFGFFFFRMCQNH